MKDLAIERVLIVNPFGIGDVLFTTPLIAALKEKFPQISISYLGNARTVPFLKNDPRIDKVFSYERDEFVAVYRKSPWKFLMKWRGFVEDIRKERFDIAFDLSLSSPLGMMLAWAGIRRRIGFNYKGRGRFLTDSILLKGYEGRHVGEYYLDLLAVLKKEEGRRKKEGSAKDVSSQYKMSLSIPSEDLAWSEAFLKNNALEGKKIVAIYPGGGASWGKSADLKRWPAQNYAKLADKIIEKSGSVVILLGNEGEIPLCQSVANLMHRKPLIAAGQTTVTRAAALMKRCQFVIANDGGPLHVAVASGVKTVSIFGPVDPDVYGPFSLADHKVVRKGLSCQPCYRNFRMSDCQHLSCLKTLTVEQVFTSLEELV